MARVRGEAETVHGSAESGDAPEPTEAFANGSILAGKYLIENTIAEGGVGIVAAAMHVTLQQRVAIKYLKTKALESKSLVDRFVREGRLAAQIRSDHVVRVHDVGVLADGAPFMVMEYLVGQDLGVVVAKGPSPIAIAVDYVLQACDALAEAHALQIVHRDIKPANLFLAERPSNTPILKIIDFGISKTLPRATPNADWARQTDDGDRFGTPLYMSPEQLRSTSTVDARADIWALGVVLHELLTGELPFEGDDLPQLVASILIKPPVPLTAARRGAPVELETILLKCLEKDRLRRFRNVAELAQELVPFGPPDAAARAARIAAVVRSGGASIRPPTPMPGSLTVQPVPVFIPPIAAANAPEGPEPPWRRKAFAWRPFALGVGLAVLGCLAAFAATLGHGASGASAAATASPSSVALPATPLLSPATPAATAQTDGPTSPSAPVVTAASAAKLEAAAAASATVIVPARSARAVAGPAPAAASVKAARANSRSEFGERE